MNQTEWKEKTVAVHVPAQMGSAQMAGTNSADSNQRIWLVETGTACPQ